MPPAARDQTSAQGYGSAGGGSYKEAFSSLSGPRNFQLDRPQTLLVQLLEGFEFLPTEKQNGRASAKGPAAV